VTKGWWSKRLASLGLGMALAFGHLAPAAQTGSPKVPLVPSKKREFRIPFNIDPAERPRYKQVQLWASSDGGSRWEKVDTVDTTTASRLSFTFRAPRDGEYWFAVRTLDTKNRLFPADDADIEPNMKVLVDTVPPQLTLEGLPRRGSLASVRWEVIDDRLDLSSFLLEYQAVGASDWAAVSIRRPGRIGKETWDAGTAEPIKVRMTVADKAGNSKIMGLQLPDGVPRGYSEGATGDPPDPTIPPPRGTFASSETERSSPSPILSGPPPMPGVGSNPEMVHSSTSGSFNPFQAHESPPSGSYAQPQDEPPDPSNPPIRVASPKFGLKYEVEDAGPNGPAAVELFVTNDGGRTWFSHGEDPDRTSPFPIDLGGEGTFGLKLVAKSAANQGDQPPTPGEVPRTVVEVDGSPPNVKLESAKIVGSKAIITWQANDPHPAPRPVMISVKSEAPGSNWQSITPTPIENTGQFTWTLPASCPPKVHFRVDVVDSLGNRGSADTTETGAVLVDRTKPKGRIIGLDSSHREGTGPTARPIR
jgi:hypothetical protein